MQMIVDIYLETGKKRVFAAALDWPGWARSGRNQAEALTALLQSGPRYARDLASVSLFPPTPDSVTDLRVAATIPGTASTDFGGLGGIPPVDQGPMGPQELKRSLSIHEACWQAFRQALAQAEGRILRTGPRGGGRSVQKMLAHVVESHVACLRRIAWSSSKAELQESGDPLRFLQGQTTLALTRAVAEGLPEQGPRGGVIWTARTFVRRAAWYLLDHAWEIEDRLV